MMKIYSLRIPALCRTVLLSLISFLVYCTLKYLVLLDYTSSSNTDSVVRNTNDVIIEEIPQLSGDRIHVTVSQNNENGDLTGERKAGPVIEEKNLHVPINKSIHCDRQRLHNAPTYISTMCNAESCKNITCHNILYTSAGNYLYRNARKWMEMHKRKFLTSEQFLEQVHSCDKFKKDWGFHMAAISEEEASFPIAYNIIMHKDIYQIAKLLQSIYRPQNIFCIHVDAKSSKSIIEAVYAFANCFENIFVATKLEKIVYAGFTRLQADINCMKDLVQTGHPWRYLLNLAGQAFPLKSNAEIVKVLRIYNGSNDIEGIYGKRILKSRFENEWLETGLNTSNPKVQKTEDKKNPLPPDDIDIVRGSAYGIFSRQFVEFLLTDEKAKNLLEWSRKTYSPDEHYWATLHHTYSNPHLKTPGGYSGKPDEKPWLAVFAAWGGVNKCHGMWRRGTCVFGIEDLPDLISKHHELFANKFYYDHQPLALECLSEYIEHKSTCPSYEPFDYQYYESLPFIKH